MSAPQLLPLAMVVVDDRTWPRRHLDQERVAEFAQAYTDGGTYALDPVQVVPLLSGKFLLINGRHRVTARERIGATDVAAQIVEHGRGDPMLFGYEYALADTARSPLPLTATEKRTAVARLLADEVPRTDVAIAELVGVSTKTVQRVRRAADTAEPTSQPPAAPVVVEGPLQVARVLVRQLDRLWISRSLGMSLGLAATDKLGDAIAEAFIDRDGPDAAVVWTQRLSTWAARAHRVAILRAEQEQS